MNNPHLEGLIRKWRNSAESWRGLKTEYADGNAITFAACAEELEEALAALPGGGVDWLDGVPTESGWYWHWDGEVFRMHFVFSRPGHAYLCTEGEPYGPGQKRNFQAVQRMGGRWSAQVKTPALPTPPPHEADRNG